jgi:alkanesulfonate monooxygenase SsuD/methylene tetrahydromethanopterin reductase-like flavin-dependent oxidoreductase (luciferase family)
MSSFTDARMHLGVEIAGAGHHPGAAGWTGADPAATAGVRHHLGMVMAARRGLDFVALPGAAPDGADALALATRMAPVVGGIDVVPGAPVADPAALAAALAGFDAASAGRVGWQPAAPARGDAAGWARVAAALEHVAGHWAAGAADPAPRPVDATDRRPAHPTPPLIVLRADDPAALPVAAGWADVVRIAAPGLDAAHEARARVRAAAAAAGRDPDDVAVLLDVEVHLAADRHRARTDLDALDALAGTAAPSSLRVTGPASDLADLVGTALRLGAADGLTLLPLVLPVDLRRVVDDAVPLLAGRGLLRAGWSRVLRRPARPVAAPVAAGVAAGVA